MRSFLPKLWAILAMALLALANSVFAQPVPGMAAHSSTASGDIPATVFVPMAANADGSMTFRLEGMYGVQMRDTVAGAKFIRGPFKDPNKAQQQPVWHFAIPDGSVVYLMGLGNDWRGGKTVEEANIARARAQGVIRGGTVTLTLPKHPSGEPCQSVNYVVQVVGTTATADRFWGSHPPIELGGFVTANKDDAPRTSLCAAGTQIVTVDQVRPAMRAELAKLP